LILLDEMMQFSLLILLKEQKTFLKEKREEAKNKTRFLT